jgi:hypothetical protein
MLDEAAHTDLQVIECSRSSYMKILRSIVLAAVVATFALPLAACAKYRTPGLAADFTALGLTPEQQSAVTSEGVREAMARRPAASFPTRIATVRLQDGEYWSYSYGRSRSGGRFSVVPSIDLERAEDAERLRRLPMIADVVPLNRIVLPDGVSGIDAIRNAAGSVQADMVLVYTLDTKFRTRTTIPALGVFTLGIFPNEAARVDTILAAALIDTRTGFVYGLVQGQGAAGQLANAWTSDDAVEDSRKRADRLALERALQQFEQVWKDIVETHARSTSASPTPAP